MAEYSKVDVMHNIQKTTEEVRNCCGTSDTQFNPHSNNGSYNDHLNENMDQCASTNSKTSNTTTESSTSESATIGLDGILVEQQQSNETKSKSTTLKIDASLTTMGSVSHKFSENGEIILDNGLCESEIVKAALTLTPDMPLPLIQSTLMNLGICLKYGNCERPNKHFRHIMKMLLNMLDAKSNEIVIDALHMLSKILQRLQMKPNWINFVELILLKIINCYPRNKETMKELESIMPRIVPTLPLNLTINILYPIIATSSYPLNLCALKLLTELVNCHGSKLTQGHLDIVFPHLVRLTDDIQSMVRKAAVFCIVKLYIVLGEEKIKPKLTMLSPNTIRLLNVFIEKQQGTASAATTEKNATKTSTATSVLGNATN